MPTETTRPFGTSREVAAIEAARGLAYNHTVNVCTVVECGRRSLGRNLCASHYHDVVTRKREPRRLARSTPCAVTACAADVYDNSLCVEHFCEDYSRQRTEAVAAAILAKVVSPDKGACWVWPAATNARGYGVVSFCGQVVLAHRLVYELLTGQRLAGSDIDHMCRVRACCNPTHLAPVDAMENARRHAAVIAPCARCNPGPIPAGGSLEERLDSWGLLEDFTAKQ